MATVATLRAKLVLEDEFTKGLTDLSTKMETASGKLSGVGTKLTLGVTAPLIAASVAAVNLAIDAEEVASKFNTVLGPAADAVNAEIAELQKTIPATRAELQNAIADFSALAQATGIAADAANQLGVDFTVAAADLASFNNSSPEQAILAIRSALVGSSEPLLAYGVDTRQAALEAKALELGLIEEGKAMDSATRATALLAQIHDDAAHAMGDAARTADSTANSMKFLKRDVEDLATTFGTDLIPVARDILTALTGLTEKTKALTPEQRQLAIQVLAVSAALGPVLRFTGLLVGWFGKLLPLVLRINPLMLALTGIFVELGRLVTGTATGVEKFIFAFTPMLGLAQSLQKVFPGLTKSTADFSNVVSGSTSTATSFVTVLQGTPDTMQAAELASNTLTNATSNLGGAAKAAESEFVRLSRSLELERIELVDGEEAARRLELAHEGLTTAQIDTVIATEDTIAALRDAKTAEEENKRAVEDLIGGLEDRRDELIYTEDQLLDNRIATLDLTQAERDAIAVIREQTRQREFQAEALRVVAENNDKAAKAEEDHAREVEEAKGRIQSRLESMVTEHLPEWAKDWKEHWQLAKDIFKVFELDLGGIIKGIMGLFNGLLSSLGGWLGSIGQTLGQAIGLFESTAAAATSMTAATTAATTAAGTAAAAGGAGAAGAGAAGAGGAVSGGTAGIGTAGTIAGNAAGGALALGLPVAVSFLGEGLMGLLGREDSLQEQHMRMMEAAEERNRAGAEWFEQTGYEAGFLTGQYANPTGTSIGVTGTSGTTYSGFTSPTKQIIEVPVNLDGAEIARVVAPIMTNRIAI